MLWKRIKSKLHQVARRVVDVDQCGTVGCTVLEPVMVAAINLDQLTTTGKTIAEFSAHVVCGGSRDRL